jgi:hypothetical protein
MDNSGQKKTTSTTLRIMAGMESRLNTLIRLENRHCGHAEGIAKADKQRDKLEDYIEREIEALARKAGCE